MVLLASNSQALEMLAAILKRDQKEEDLSKPETHRYEHETRFDSG